METGVSEAPLSFETTIVTRIYHSTSRNIPQFFFFLLIHRREPPNSDVQVESKYYGPAGGITCLARNLINRMKAAINERFSASKLV